MTNFLFFREVWILFINIPSISRIYFLLTFFKVDNVTVAVRWLLLYFPLHTVHCLLCWRRWWRPATRERTASGFSHSILDALTYLGFYYFFRHFCHTLSWNIKTFIPPMQIFSSIYQFFVWSLDHSYGHILIFKLYLLRRAAKDAVHYNAPWCLIQISTIHFTYIFGHWRLTYKWTVVNFFAGIDAL